MYYAGWQMIAEYNGAGALQRKYVYGPGIDEPVRMTVTASPLPLTYYFHCDGLGSVTEITGSTGQLVERYRYDVYGSPTFLNASGSAIAASAIGNRLLFTGRDRDPDTTWYNYRYRYYNPTLGRFAQPDPIGIKGRDVNLYRYAVGNPVVRRDPVGLWSVSVSAYAGLGMELRIGKNPDAKWYRGWFFAVKVGGGGGGGVSVNPRDTSPGFDSSNPCQYMFLGGNLNVQQAFGPLNIGPDASWGERAYSEGAEEGVLPYGEFTPGDYELSKTKLPKKLGLKLEGSLGIEWGLTNLESAFGVH